MEVMVYVSLCSSSTLNQRRSSLLPRCGLICMEETSTRSARIHLWGLLCGHLLLVVGHSHACVDLHCIVYSSILYVQLGYSSTFCVQLVYSSNLCVLRVQHFSILCVQLVQYATVYSWSVYSSIFSASCDQLIP